MTRSGHSIRLEIIFGDSGIQVSRGIKLSLPIFKRGNPAIAGTEWGVGVACNHESRFTVSRSIKEERTSDRIFVTLLAALISS